MGKWAEVGYEDGRNSLLYKIHKCMHMFFIFGEEREVPPWQLNNWQTVLDLATVTCGVLFQVYILGMV